MSEVLGVSIHRRKVIFSLAAWLAVATWVCAVAAHAQQPAAQEKSTAGLLLSVDAAKSKAHFTLNTSLHTVHGEFSVKRGSVQFDPETGNASGEVVVDATSGQSGNNSRDKRMHKEILESPRFMEIVFRPDRVTGKVAPTGSSSAQVHGMFTLHGSEHELTVPVNVEFTGSGWKGTAAFEVPYIQWGLKNPSNFLLKASPTVNIELEMAGQVAGR